VGNFSWNKLINYDSGCWAKGLTFQSKSILLQLILLLTNDLVKDIQNFIARGIGISDMDINNFIILQKERL